MTTAQKWRKMLAWLRRTFPPLLPIRVRSVPAKRLHKREKWEGCCWLNTDVGKLGRYEIQVNRQMSTALRLDVLIHEWAHAMTWFGAEHTEAHSAEWGMAYARIYRAFCEWNYSKPLADAEEEEGE